MFTNVRNWIVRRPRRTGVGLTLVIFLIAWSIWAMRVAERAENLATELRSTGAAAETALTAADPATIAEISASLEISRRSAQELDEDLWPLRWTGAVVGRVPLIGGNVTAVPDLVRRLNDDLTAAVSLVDAAQILVTVYGDLPTRDAGLVETLNALPEEREIIRAVRLMDQAELALERADGRASRMENDRLLGKLKSESNELGVQEARLREIVEWAGLAADSLLALVRLSEISLPLVGLLDSEDPSGAALGRDAISAMPELEAAARDAYEAVVSTNARAPSGIDGSQIGNVMLDFEPILGAVADLSKAGALTSVAVSPALDKMESSEGGLIGEGTSSLTALELLKDGRSEFQEASRILELIAPTLRAEELNTQVAVATARTVSDASVELARAVGFLAEFPEIGSQALGTDGPKRYLVLGQTSDELRGSGGFVSGAWILTFEDGQMSDIEYHDIVGVDDVNRLDIYPLPPDLMAQHMDAPVWLLRDATWSPEFPAAARTAAEIFELGQGGPPVDGVIALTQWGIISLVGVLGAIETDNGEIQPGELLAALEEGTDADGRAFVDTLLRSVLEQIRSPGVNDRLFGIARAAAEMLSQKDTMVFMFDPELQDIVARSGWDGSLGRPDGDRIAVIDSNIGWNKVDRNIERSFEYHVALRPAETMIGRLSLSYHNMSDPGSRGCEVQAPIHGLSYAELKESCYWNLVRVYIPDGGGLLSNDPLPIPPASVYARVAAGLPGGDSVSIGVDSGGKFISGLLVVPPGESTTVGFDILIPADAVVSDGDMLTYRLSLTAQSGALGRDALINLELPPGYKYVGGSHEPVSIGESEIEFAISLVSDTTIELVMQRTTTLASSDSEELIGVFSH